MGRTEADDQANTVRIINQAPNYGVQGVFNGPVYQATPRANPSPQELLAAETRARALPLTPLPDRAPLPAGSYMRMSANPLFTARAAELGLVAEMLREPVTVALSGVGGSGKTQLASEFVHRYGQFFSGVYWLSMPDANTAVAEVANCGRTGLLDVVPSSVQLSTEQQAELVLIEWSTAVPRLLIFDNCEDEAILSRWRPASGKARILLTCRRGRWDSTLGIKLIPIHEFERADSVQFFLRHRPDLKPTDPDLPQIADELGNLPLALHLAGSFLATYRNSKIGGPAAYLQKLRSTTPLTHSSMADGDSTYSPTNHEQSVQRTFAISFEQLDAKRAVDLQSIQVLQRASFCAPGIPVLKPFLFWTTLDEPDDEDAIRSAEKVVARLIALGLLQEQSDGTLRMHRLVAQFISLLGPHSGDREFVERGLVNLFNAPRQEAETVRRKPLEPHLLHVALAAVTARSERGTQLAIAVGAWCRLNWDYEEAYNSDKTALDLAEHLYGVDTIETAQSLNAVGYDLHYLRKYEPASTYLLRAAALYCQANEFGNLAATLDNLAQVKSAQTLTKEAIQFYSAALHLRVEHLGPEDPDTAITYFNLGSLLKTQGDFANTRGMLETALAIRRKAFPGPHRMTAASLVGLGALYLDMGLKREAADSLKEGAAMTEAVLGSAHPRMAGVLGWLAAAYSSLGETELAEEALTRSQEVQAHDKDTSLSRLNFLGLSLWLSGRYWRARESWEAALVLADRLPNWLAISLNNVGMVLMSQGDYAKSHEYFEKALAVELSNQSYGGALTARFTHNLGSVLRRMGDFAAARNKLENAYASRLSIFGEEARDTLITGSELALALAEQGDLSLAQTQITKVLEISHRVLGEDKDTARAYFVAGAIAHLSRDNSQAINQFKEALRTQTTQSGPTHPDLGITMAALGRVYRDDAKPTEALPLFERAVELLSPEVLPTHPDLIRIQNNLKA